MQTLCRAESPDLSAYLDKRAARFRTKTTLVREPADIALGKRDRQNSAALAREGSSLAQYLDQRAERFNGKEVAKPETPQRRAASLDLDRSIELTEENLLVLHRAAAQSRAVGDHAAANLYQTSFNTVLRRVELAKASRRTPSVQLDRAGAAATKRLLCREGQRISDGRTLSKNHVFGWALNWSKDGERPIPLTRDGQHVGEITKLIDRFGSGGALELQADFALSPSVELSRLCKCGFCFEEKDGRAARRTGGTRAPNARHGRITGRD